VSVPPIAVITASIPLVFFSFLAVLVVAGTVIRGLFFLGRRREEMKAMALRCGLRPSAPNVLPRGLSLHGSHFQHWSSLTTSMKALSTAKKWSYWTLPSGKEDPDGREPSSPSRPTAR